MTPKRAFHVIATTMMSAVLLVAGGNVRADAPPPDIQAILDKIKAGKTVSDDDMRAYQLWMLRKSNGTRGSGGSGNGSATGSAGSAAQPSEDQNPLMPPDVQEIIARVQAGNRPSPADIARLQAYGASVKNNQAKIIRDVKDAGALLRGATGPGLNPAYANKPKGTGISGTVTLDINQSMKMPNSNAQYTATATIPISYAIDAVDPKGFHLHWWGDPKGSYSFSYQNHTTASGGKDCPQVELSQNVQSSGSLKDGKVIFNGQIVAPSGSRVYTDAQLVVTATGPTSINCGGGTAPAPPMLLEVSLDGMRDGIPWNYGTGDLTAPSPYKVLAMKSIPGMQAASDGATFNFDTAAITKALSDKGGSYKTTSTYHWKQQLAAITQESTVKMTFTLLLAPPKTLHAHAGGPYQPTRGDAVTLDSSTTTGNPNKWLWTLTPQPCPGPMPQTADGGKTKDTKTWSVKLLCDTKVKLEVWNADGDHDEDETTVSVQPRTGKKWQVAWKDSSAAVFNGPIKTEGLGLFFGRNSCSEDDKGDYESPTGDVIHQNQSTNDYKDQVNLTTVSDSDGPFDGWSYVASQTLHIKRNEDHSSFLEAGDIYQLNKTNGTLPAFNRLVAAIKEHEASHSKVIHNKLNDMIANNTDAAQQIEAVVAKTDDSEWTAINQAIGSAESTLDTAAHDENGAKALMHDHGGGTIWTKTVNSNVPVSLDFPDFKVLGDTQRQ